MTSGRTFGSLQFPQALGEASDTDIGQDCLECPAGSMGSRRGGRHSRMRSSIGAEKPFAWRADAPYALLVHPIRCRSPNFGLPFQHERT